MASAARRWSWIGLSVALGCTDPVTPWPTHAWVGAQIEAGDVLRYSKKHPPRVRLAAPVSGVQLRLVRGEATVNLSLSTDMLGDQRVFVAQPSIDWAPGPATIELAAPGQSTQRRSIMWGATPPPPSDVTEARIPTLDPATRGAAWRQLARAASRAGDTDLSVSRWRAAAAAADAAGQITEGARFRRAAINHLVRVDRLDEAEQLLDMAQAISTRVDDALGLARAAEYRAWIAQKRGDVRAARDWYDRGARSAVQAGDRRMFDKLRILGAVTAQYAGRHREAIGRIESIAAESVVRSGHARTDLDANDAWIRIRAAAQGAAPLPDGDVADRLKRARDFLLAEGRPTDAANLEENLALLYVLQGDLPAAEAQLASRRARKVPSNDRFFVDLLAGRIALAAGRDDDAAAAFERIRSHTEAAIGPSAEYGWRAAFGLGRVARRRGDRIGARAHFEAAIAGMERQAARTPIDTSRAAFFADHRALVEAAVELALEERRFADAYAVIDADRARLTQALDVSLRVRRLPSAERSRFRTARAALLASSARFEAARRDGDLARDQDAWAARRRVEAREMRDAFDALHAILDQHAAPRPSATAVRLRADERIISAWRQGDAAVVLVAGPDGVTRPADWQATLPAQGHVWIVDGPEAESIHARIPPALTVARIPYAGWLARPPGGAGGAAVVLGDPDGTLPAAHAEARFVAGHLGVDPVSRQDARPEALLRAVDRAQTFHFAGHGVLSARDPFDAHLRLADQTRLGVVDLLMARPQIGLAVLSGCDTSTRGTLAGEHAVGLAHAFLIAGAEQVVAASQPVDDRATRAFMERFYRAGGATDPARALRTVQASGGPWRLWGRR